MKMTHLPYLTIATQELGLDDTTIKAIGFEELKDIVHSYLAAIDELHYCVINLGSEEAPVRCSEAVREKGARCSLCEVAGLDDVHPNAISEMNPEDMIEIVEEVAATLEGEIIDAPQSTPVKEEPVKEETPAAVETTVAEETIKEEETPMSSKETVTFNTPDEMAAHLISTGISPIQAVSIAQAQFAAATETTPIPETPAVTVTPEATPATPVVPTAEAKTEAEEKLNNGKPWFKKAVDNMKFGNQASLQAELVKLKLDSKDPVEKAEIQAELDKLRSESGTARFNKFYKKTIADFKGWSIDASGKVADALYVTGDYAGKGASGLTKVTGKIVQSTGKAITKSGEFIEEQADTVGKAVEAPFKYAGDVINTVNGTKKK